MTADKPRIGFIGVGLMGHGMAKNIVEKGYPLSVMGHRNRKPVEDLVKRGAKEAKSPKAMARACDVIFLCVTSSAEVEDLVRRRDGIKAGAHKGLILVDTSTSDPASTLALAAELKPLGVRLIDAPLGRTPKEAEQGRLNSFVGGDAKTLKAIRPIMETWAENIIPVGPLGNGHKIKLINNFVAVSYAAIYAEAFTTAQKTGIDLKTFYDVIAAGGLYSGIFENISKWVLYGDPKAHLFTLRNCRKDIGYYTKLTDSAPTTALVANAVKQTYEIAYALGKGDLHMPMLGDVLAELNNSELPKPGP